MTYCNAFFFLLFGTTQLHLILFIMMQRKEILMVAKTVNHHMGSNKSFNRSFTSDDITQYAYSKSHAKQ